MPWGKPERTGRHTNNEHDIDTTEFPLAAVFVPVPVFLWDVSGKEWEHFCIAVIMTEIPCSLSDLQILDQACHVTCGGHFHFLQSNSFKIVVILLFNIKVMRVNIINILKVRNAQMQSINLTCLFDQRPGW